MEKKEEEEGLLCVECVGDKKKSTDETKMK